LGLSHYNSNPWIFPSWKNWGRFRHITEFDEFGDPLSPPIALTKYKTILGLLVRDFIPIRYRKWNGKIMTHGGFLKVRRITCGISRSQSISLSQWSMTRR